MKYTLEDIKNGVGWITSWIHILENVNMDELRRKKCIQQMNTWKTLLELVVYNQITASQLSQEILSFVAYSSYKGNGKGDPYDLPEKITKDMLNVMTGTTVLPPRPS